MWSAVVSGLLVLAFASGLPARYIFAPALGVVILLFGKASVASFGRGASYIPDGPPQPVDMRSERTTYWCAGCGAELLLLMRGTASAPRHCGEKMVERHEVAHA